MSDLIEQLKEKKTEIEDLKEKKAQQLGEKKQVLSQLSSKYEVSSLEEGLEKVEELKKRRSNNKAKLEEINERMGEIINSATKK